jgi:hypothetical protein
MLIVFPELQTSFREPKILERWTDTVVLPAFRQLGISDGVLTSSFKVIQMTAEAEREQTLNTYAPDTPIVEVLSRPGGMAAQDTHNLWVLIQENANKTAFFDGFKNLFLVAVCRQSTMTALPIEDAWQMITHVWDGAIDMNFVPVETVRANASATIHAHHIGSGANFAPSRAGHTTNYQQTSGLTWESSRKRKAEDGSDIGRRLRSDSEQTRPNFASMCTVKWKYLQFESSPILTIGRSTTVPEIPLGSKDIGDIEMSI